MMLFLLLFSEMGSFSLYFIKVLFPHDGIFLKMLTSLEFLTENTKGVETTIYYFNKIKKEPRTENLQVFFCNKFNLK